MIFVLEKYSVFVLFVIFAASANFATSANVATSLGVSEVKMAAKHERWMARYGRVYADKEEKESRFKIFKDNAQFIRNFNRAGNQTYKLEINRFADLTHEEFLASHASGYKTPQSSHTQLSSASFKYENVSIEDVEPWMDWRVMGAVTSVKSQPHCGCCWAFSAVGAIEGITKIKTGRLVSLSVQQIVDCMGEANGCQGGVMDNAFNYVAHNGGLLSEEEYPYRDYQEACRIPMAYPAAQIATYEKIPYGDEGALLRAVSNQPVSVAIDARMIQYYRSGVVTGYCGTSLNHGVVVVGYGTSEDGIKYWLLKNSWGEGWGENGYLRVQRDYGTREGMCGIAMDPTYPIMW